MLKPYPKKEIAMVEYLKEGGVKIFNIDRNEFSIWREAGCPPYNCDATGCTAYLCGQKIYDVEY